MKKYLLLLWLFSSLTCLGQDELQSIFRINALSPGLELEMPISKTSTLAINPGIGINGSYANLSYANSGILYFISPFIDVSYKEFYNIDKRLAKGKSIAGNAGDYVGIRLLSNFKEFKAENIIRKDNVDFALGPVWGIQRALGNIHFLFDVGPVYYFDTKGNGGFFPIMLQLNVGFNVKKW